MADQYAVSSENGVYGPFATDNGTGDATTDAKVFSTTYGGPILTLRDPANPPEVMHPDDAP